MVRIRGTLNEDLTRFFHDSIQGPLDEFRKGYACAGIRDNVSAAKKASGNHHGEYYTKKGQTVAIPARQFIWAATKDIVDGNVGFTANEIRDILTKAINQRPRVQKQREIATIRIDGIDKSIRHTDVRALPVFKGGNFDGVFEKLADKMRDRLVSAIENVDIVGSDNPTIGGTTKIIRASARYGQVQGDIRHNAETTIYKKGFDHPLVETEEMMNAIEVWTNGKNKN